MLKLSVGDIKKFLSLANLEIELLEVGHGL
jgi:hypothetical protein